ncbi:hypothetical protein GC197_04975 [bacterium]|nr:hypothetical protein [bacterium]
MRTSILGLILVTTLGIFAQPLFAQQASDRPWGTVEGRFLIEGKMLKRPAALPLVVPAFAKPPLVVPQIGKKGQIANVAVWLYHDKGEKLPQPHPMYEKAKQQPVSIISAGCQFGPHIAMVREGQTADFVNADPVPNNFKLEGFMNQGVNFLIKPNMARKYEPASEERFPMQLTSSIYPWMKSYLMVRESPYMAVSDADGKFKIENLPVGKHRLQVWHEVPGFVKSIVTDGQEKEYRRGIIEIDVQPGQNDLGDLSIPAVMLFGF